MAKRLLALLLIMALFTVGFFTMGAADDIKNHWAGTEIRRMEALGVFVREGESYETTKAVTRGEFLKMLLTACGYTAESEAISNARSNFRDMSKTHPYNGYMTLGYELGLIDTVPGGYAEPDRIMTRGEAVLMVMELVGEGETAYPVAAFSDRALLEEPIASACDGAAELGILYFENSVVNAFGENTELSRAEALVMINNYLRAMGLLYDYIGTVSFVQEDTVTLMFQGRSASFHTYEGTLKQPKEGSWVGLILDNAGRLVDYDLLER